ncbi:PilN domain-containing protein [Pelosinus sp. sgz500959]|uniref:PilN domain-containing protein n=1 Tax=Pelosinus sp. sgz500959 TaxID=3242472 RepID=UPI00366D8B41
MIRINLLPVTERQPKWPVNRLLVATGLLVIMVLSSIYTYTLYDVWSLERQLQNTRNQYQLLQPTRTLMASAKNKQQQFDKKNNIVTLLTKERRSWYGIIQHLTADTSPHIWFTELAKSDKGAIQIKGWTATYPLVAEFMQTIEQDQFFIEPTLTNVERNGMTQTATFEILVKPRGI